MASPLAWCLSKLVRAYQLFVSPLLGPNCRYAPSCSAYALEAVEKHGAVKGAWLAVKRISRCHPWGGSGYDPVPDTEQPKDMVKPNGQHHKNGQTRHGSKD